MIKANLTSGSERKLSWRPQLSIRVVVSGSGVGNSRSIELQSQCGGASRLVTSDGSRARVWAVAGRSSWVRADAARCSTWLSACRWCCDNSRDVCCRLGQSCSEPAKSEDNNVAEHGCRYDCKEGEVGW